MTRRLSKKILKKYLDTNVLREQEELCPMFWESVGGTRLIFVKKEGKETLLSS